MARVGYAEWDEEDSFDWVDEHPSRRVKRRPLPWLRIVLISSCTVAGLAYLALEREKAGQPLERPKPVASSVLIAPAPTWKPVPAEPAPFILENPSGPVTSEARQNAGGTREDTLILGNFGDPRSARVSLVQGPAEPTGSLFVDIVRRAAGAGLAVAHHAQSRMVGTKFGPVEAASMTLSGRTEQECQAFRFSEPDTDFGFQGWLCGADESQLTCFIDGIGLAGGTNLSLKGVFARAEGNRTSACGASARPASKAVRNPLRS